MGAGVGKGRVGAGTARLPGASEVLTGSQVWAPPVRSPCGPEPFGRGQHREANALPGGMPVACPPHQAHLQTEPNVLKQGSREPQ